MSVEEIDVKIAEAERAREVELELRRAARPGRYAGDDRLASVERALRWLRAERTKLERATERAAAGVQLCHALGCTRRVAPQFLMCARHWRFVPAELRRHVYAAYRSGQEHPSRPYVAAAREAIDAVAAAEAGLAQQKDQHS